MSQISAIELERAGEEWLGGHLLIISLVLSAVAALLFAKIYGALSLPAFSMYLFGIGFSIRAAFLTFSSSEYVFGVYVPSTLSSTILFCGICCQIAIAFGILIGAGPINVKPTRYSRFPVLSNSGAIWRTYIVAILILLTQMALFARTLGGLHSAVIALSRRSFTGQSLGFSTNLTFGYVPIFAYCALMAKDCLPTVGRNLMPISLFLLIPWVTVANGRTMAVVVIWTYAVLWSMREGRLPRLRWVVVAASGVYLISVIGLSWRTATQTGQSFSQAVSAEGRNGLSILSESLPLYDHFRIGILYGDSVGHDMGRSLIIALLVLIPRAIWPTKPLFLPQLIGQVTQYNQLTGLPAGLLGEGYISFGWVGPVIYSLFFGIAVGLFHRALAWRRFDGIFVCWAVFTSGAWVLTCLRTGAQGGLIVVQASVLMLILVLFVERLAGVRERVARQPLSHPTSANDEAIS